MKEINEAYDAIVDERKKRKAGQQPGGSSYYNAYANTSSEYHDAVSYTHLLIIAGNDYTSFRKSGWLQALAEEQTRKNARMDWSVISSETPFENAHGNCVADQTKNPKDE